MFFSVLNKIGRLDRGWGRIEFSRPKKMDRSQIFRPSLNKSRLYQKNLGLFCFRVSLLSKSKVSRLASDPRSKMRKSRSSYFRVHSVAVRRSAHRVCSEFARNCVSNIGDGPPSGAWLAAPGVGGKSAPSENTRQNRRQFSEGWLVRSREKLNSPKFQS